MSHLRFVTTHVILTAVILAATKCWAKQVKEERKGLFWFTSLGYGPSWSGKGGTRWQRAHNATVCIASAVRDERSTQVLSSLSPLCLSFSQGPNHPWVLRSLSQVLLLGDSKPIQVDSEKQLPRTVILAFTVKSPRPV